MSQQNRPSLHVVSAGLGVSLQDAGRFGYLRYGVTCAGPMDPLAHATANAAVMNAADATAIEVSLGGMAVTTDESPLRVAVAGGDASIKLGDRVLPSDLVLTLHPGELLKISAGASGCWSYLAVEGGFDVPLVLGSSATHTRSHMGGIDGRSLLAGDRIRVFRSGIDELPTSSILAPWLDRPADVIRVVPGPQADYFDPEQTDAFLKGPWTVSARGDRMACFLEGPRIAHGKGFNIVSDGIAMGAIQIPGEGQPIVLMADRQSTGGYPKIATVIRADLGRLAQARPGASLRFSAITIGEAVAALRAQVAVFERTIATEPLVRKTLSSEFLLGVNLIDGFVDCATQPSLTNC